MEDIRHFTKHGTWYGKSFTVFIWNDEKTGKLSISEVTIEGIGTFKNPVPGQFDTLDSATDAGFRFAVGEIND